MSTIEHDSFLFSLVSVEIRQKTIVKSKIVKVTAPVLIMKTRRLCDNLRHFSIRTGYREAMLNLLHALSLKRLPLLSQVHIILLFHI